MHAASEKVAARPDASHRARGALSARARVRSAARFASREVSPYAACGSIARNSFPRRYGRASQARRRLVYEEVLALEMHLIQQAQAELGDASPRTHVVDGPARSV